MVLAVMNYELDFFAENDGDTAGTGLAHRDWTLIFSHFPVDTYVERVISASIRRKLPSPYKTKTSNVVVLLANEYGSVEYNSPVMTLEDNL